MSNLSIKVENISKRYRIGARRRLRRQRSDVITDLVSAPIRNFRRLRGLSKFSDNDAENQDVLWALKDVSFEVEPGEVMGIVGSNGAGKTTLLKILSRITEPTEGHAEIHGRVGHLLEIGTGFHPELTGRDNVYLNGAVLGMTRKEIDLKFDEIVEFAELEKFIDTPAKRYSAGMGARLGFSVAAHLQVEILVVDEVLAVGDAAFQRKCMGRLDEAGKEGRTVLFVSHNMAALSHLCTRAIWIENGRIRLAGSTREVVGAYLASADAQEAAWSHPPDHCRDPLIQLVSARILSADDKATTAIPFNEQFKIEIAYTVPPVFGGGPLLNASILSRLTDAHGNVVLTSLDTDTNGWDGTRKSGQYQSLCNIPGDFLRPGRYYLTVGSRVKTPRRHTLHATAVNDHEHVLSFDISEVGFHLDMDRPGVVAPSLDWDVKNVDGQN